MKIALLLVSMTCVSVWAYCAFNFMRMLGHRRADVPLSSLLLSGMKAFEPQYFSTEGHVYQRRFKRGFVAFFACVFVGAVTVAIGSSL
jgi:hypothetical protein